MEWARTWDWASAVVYANGKLEFRSGYYGFTTMRKANPPAVECTTRYLCVSDYWSARA